MNIFLDDKRKLEDIFPNADPKDWRVIRCPEEFLNLIAYDQFPNFVAFDHDLGTWDDRGIEITGYTVAKAMVSMDIDGTISIPSTFSFSVHSSNWDGHNNIDSYLSNYMKFKFGNSWENKNE